MTEIDKIILDALKEIKGELRELRREYRDDQEKSTDRITKLEVEQGKQKVRTGLIGAISGVLTGVGTRLF